MNILLLITILIMFRLVPISEASVVIAISSVHRKDSLEAVQYCIDQLKANVPIWKKVIYNLFCPDDEHVFIPHFSCDKRIYSLKDSALQP